GISVPFGATAVACRLLALDEHQTWNALGLVFNRCGGSFQSNIDGTLAVRVIQGWVAQESLLSARHAQLGLTGPVNFLSGIYGYEHLYCHDHIPIADLLDELGSDYRLRNMAFKKYPSCAMTSGPTDAILGILKDYSLDPDDIVNITVTLPPYGHRLVGHDFKIGDNPTVDGQFCTQYCIANVLLRGNSRIQHFTADSVLDPEIEKYISRITVLADKDLDYRGHTATDMRVTTKDGKVYKRGMDVAPGFPGNSLTDEDHMQRFMDCMDFGAERIERSRIDAILSFIRNITAVEDVRALVPLLTEVPVE
ncbi:MAG TPA: MmgE/PrpD family protein, partial [bacterium]|nr:MmgE/PrpD family protein [bacterium]